MIIVRSPFRVTLGGGGTDLPSYYRDYGGFLIAAAIDRYMYITVQRRFMPNILLKYMQIEEVDSIDAIKHPVIREVLRMTSVADANLEITSMADLPSGTGMGSSGSFTTALLKALHVHHNRLVPTQELAEEACRIEIDILKEPIGKQDQYIAAFGGLTCFRFMSNDQVEVSPLKIDLDTMYSLEENLLLFFTGFSRSASAILKDQDEKSKARNEEMIANLHVVKELGFQTKDALEKGDLKRFAELMHIHWEHKKKRSSGMSNERIDGWYELARKNGALGGKLIGAGGGGFLMFYAEDRVRLRRAMREAGLGEVRFRFDFEGSKVVVQS